MEGEHTLRVNSLPPALMVESIPDIKVRLLNSITLKECTKLKIGISKTKFVCFFFLKFLFFFDQNVDILIGITKNQCIFTTYVSIKKSSVQQKLQQLSLLLLVSDEGIHLFRLIFKQLERSNFEVASNIINLLYWQVTLLLPSLLKRWSAKEVIRKK